MPSTKAKAPVSVIIPCYNCVSTIRRAVHSIVQQTVLPIQLVLVDDGSSDGTLDALHQIQVEYGRDFVDIVMLTHNSGPAVARNSGWNIATGDYIAFLDADDAWHPQKIETQYEWMRGNADFILTGHLCRVVTGEMVTNPIPAVWGAKPIGSWELLLSNKFSTPTVMLRRSIPYRFQDGQRYSEDYLLWSRILLSGNKACQLQLPLTFLYKARYGAGGLSACLWPMEKGELSNFRVLYREKMISFVEYLFLSIYSLAKYLRRKVRVIC